MPLTNGNKNRIPWRQLSKINSLLTILQYISAIFGFEALHQFVTYTNGFQEPESQNFDPNHALLGSIEAEIIIFLPNKAPIFYVFYIHLVNMAPLS